MTDDNSVGNRTGATGRSGCVEDPGPWKSFIGLQRRFENEEGLNESGLSRV